QSSCGYFHHEVGSWAQIDLRLEFNGFVAGASEAEAARHGVDMDQHLEHRDILADAVPRAHGEGYVGKSMAFRGVGAGKALGPEFLRLAPEGRMPMQHIGTDEHIGA